MNDAQKQALMWAAIVILLCYVFGINPVTTIGSLMHGLQQMHQANVNH